MGNLRIEWNKIAQDVLQGRTIVSVRYMTEAEQRDLMWSKKPIVITLDNGTLAFLSADDEGNDGGSLFYITKGESHVLPTL